MSHSYTMESESLHPESAPMTPLPALAPPSSSSPHSATAVPAPVPLHPQPVPRVKSTKPHVPSACINCKKAHLACDLSRPCKRCISVGKDDTCRDVEHKKRGRPKLVDKLVAVDGVWSTAAKDGSVAASKAVSSTTTAAALAKTRVKGKYTKSTNYKMPRKTTNGAKAPTEAFAVPQTNTPSRDIVLDAPQGRPSSYPSHHEQERPSSSMSYRTHPPSAQSYQGRPLSMHSEPPLPGDHQDPFYYPSPTSQIKRPQELYSGPSSTPLATVFLTMGLICARVSDESQVLWGYHPHDISNKPLYSIIANEDQSKMRNLMGLIRDAVFSAASPNGQHLSHFPFLESTSAVFYQNRPDIMSSSAPGSNEYTDVIRVCRADGGSELFSVRMYVGGGLGTDLVRGLNIEHAYVVCIMAHHAPPVMNDHPRNNQRLSLDDSRTASHNNAHGSNLAESQYNTMRQPLSQPQLSPLESRNGNESSKKISLPPIFTDARSTNSPSLSSSSVSSPLSANSLNGRPSVMFGSSAPSGSMSSSSSSSYTVSLSKPSSHSSSLPSMRTGPLHTARWLYDSEPFGGPGPTHSPNHRLPTIFSDPFRSISAPMGGFGVAKYLGGQRESIPSFNNIRRHQLPLPSSSTLQASQGLYLDPASRNPKTLQRDLSSSSFGASFASRSPPSSMKRPLADMADSQDRNRDIDNRHQDHHQHQVSRSSMTSDTMSSSASSSSRPSYQSSIKLDLQAMPPDHPTIDPSSAGVCPIVHGSQQRDRVRQAQLQVNQLTREVDMKESHSHSVAQERGPCRWAKMTDEWRDCRDDGPPGHDCFGSESISDSHEHRREHLSEQERGADAQAAKDYFDHEGSVSTHRHPLSSGAPRYSGDNNIRHFSTQGEDRSHASHQAAVNPFSTGPSSPTEAYGHHRCGSTLRRTSSVGRSPFINRGKGPVVCLSGACGSVCRCSGEDEETRAEKAMDAARKRMSVHSLLC